MAASLETINLVEDTNNADSDSSSVTTETSSLDSDTTNAQAPKSNAYSCSPGLCVIINNMEFDDPRLNLPSGEKDEAILKFIYELLGFDVEVHRNLKAAGIKSTVEMYRQRQHTGAFFLIIFSHGGAGDVVYGTDGGAVAVQELKERFYATQCPSLAGIPKVLMVDACRGAINEPVHRFTPKAGPQSSSTSSATSVTDSADIMTIFASARGNIAGCDENEGSIFTQTFANVLKKVSVDKNLTDIMKKVQRKIQKLQVQTPHLETSFSKSYYITRDTGLNAYLELNKKLQKAVRKWLPVRKQTIKEIREVAEALQKHHRNVNISRITGATTSIGGSGLAILGFALTPFTFGGSLALAGVGIGAAVLGGTTVAGASAVDIVLEKMKLKEVQKQYDEDQSQLRYVQERITEMNKIIENVYQRYPDRQNNADEFLPIMTQFLSGAVRTGSLGIRIAELAVAGSQKVGVSALRIGGAAAKGIAGAAIALNIILIPIDIFEIIRSSFSLASGSKTKAIDKLLEHATELEEQMESVMKDL